MNSGGGGRFDFDDGGTYCGGWAEGKAHGHGVCTGPKGQGEFAGAWLHGFEVSGVYTWPSGSTYEGQWMEGRRHGLGAETRGRWTYRGEWTAGFKGRYGVRHSLSSLAKYEGTWAAGLQDGYGSEMYADGGTYQGQWAKGMRQGYGVRSSAPYGLASHSRHRPGGSTGHLPTTEDESTGGRGGFVLKGRGERHPTTAGSEKRGLLQRLRRQKSAGEIVGVLSVGSSGAVSSASSDSVAATEVSWVSQDEVMDSKVIETYMGEWKGDKRSGFGIAERSDGLRYEGEWHNNKKYGYGVTYFKDGSREQGKYKNNVLVTSGRRKHLFLLRSAKFKERINAATTAAVRSSQIALEKADIAISRTATARGKAESADIAVLHAREDADIARLMARQLAPDFHQPGLEHQHPKPNLPPPRRSPGDVLSSPASIQRTRQDNPRRRTPPPTTNGDMSPARPARRQMSHGLAQAMDDHLAQYRGATCPSPAPAHSRSPAPIPTYQTAVHYDMDTRGRRSTLPHIVPEPSPLPAPTVAVKRKKSLPDALGPDAAISREEAAELSSHRREELRRETEEADKYRANPLLYLISPDLRDWLSRQQLVMIVLFINISLAIMFFKLLT